MTRTRIVALLFALFVSGALTDGALANYRPGTGKWLERDPLGAPHFHAAGTPAVRVGMAHAGLARNGTGDDDLLSERLIGHDPMEHDAKNVVNLYCYVGNNPTNVNDPSGLAGMLEPRPDWAPWEPKPENRDVPRRMREFDDRVNACVQRCLEAVGTKQTICVAIGVSPGISLPLKPRTGLGTSNPWTTPIRAIGGKVCRVISRAVNPWANIACVTTVCYSMGNVASCRCLCSQDPDAF